MATNQNQNKTLEHSVPDSAATISHDQLENIFESYGINNGMHLIKGTQQELRDRGIEEFNPTPVFATNLRQSFEAAFIDRARVPLIPDAVEIANREATGWTIHNFLDAEFCQLRKAVLPKFYKQVVYFFSFAAANGADIQAGIYYDDDDDDGRGPLVEA